MKTGELWWLLGVDDSELDRGIARARRDLDTLGRQGQRDLDEIRRASARTGRDLAGEIEQGSRRAARGVDALGRDAQRDLTRTGQAAGRAGREIGTEIGQGARRAAAEIDRASRQSTADLARLERQARETGRGVGASMKGALGGLALGAGATAGVQEYLAVGKEFGKVTTLVGDMTEKETEALKERLKTIGAELGQTQAQMLPAAYSALSSGVDKGDLQEFLKVSDMLSDTGVDSQTTVRALAGVTNAYEDLGETYGSVADKMTALVDLGAADISVETLATELAKVTPIASKFNVSLSETFALIGQNSLTGMGTAENTTAVASLYKELADSAVGAGKAFQEATGGSWLEFTANGGTMVETFRILDAEMARTGQTAADLFGAEAMITSLNSMGGGLDAFAAAADKIEQSQGRTARMHALIMDDSQEAADSLKVSMEALKVSGGEALVPLLDDAARLLTVFTDLSQNEVAVTIAKWAGAFLAVTAAARMLSRSAGAELTTAVVRGTLARIAALRAEAAAVGITTAAYRGLAAPVAAGTVLAAGAGLLAAGAGVAYAATADDRLASGNRTNGASGGRAGARALAMSQAALSAGTFGLADGWSGKDMAEQAVRNENRNQDQILALAVKQRLAAQAEYRKQAAREVNALELQGVENLSAADQKRLAALKDGTAAALADAAEAADKAKKILDEARGSYRGSFNAFDTVTGPVGADGKNLSLGKADLLGRADAQADFQEQRAKDLQALKDKQLSNEAIRELLNVEGNAPGTIRRVVKEGISDRFVAEMNAQVARSSMSSATVATIARAMTDQLVPAAKAAGTAVGKAQGAAQVAAYQAALASGFAAAGFEAAPGTPGQMRATPLTPQQIAMQQRRLRNERALGGL